MLSFDFSGLDHKDPKVRDLIIAVSVALDNFHEKKAKFSAESEALKELSDSLHELSYRKVHGDNVSDEVITIIKDCETVMDSVYERAMSGELEPGQVVVAYSMHRRLVEVSIDLHR